MGDDLVRRRRAPLRAVPSCVGVADKGRVVPPDERPVEGRTDTRIGLCAGDDKPPGSEARQHGLEGGALEGIAVVLLDERLGVVPEPARGRSASRRSLSQAARRSAGPRRRGPVRAAPCRQGWRCSRPRRRAREPPSTTPFCTSMTTSAVFGRFSSVVMVSPYSRWRPWS